MPKIDKKHFDDLATDVMLGEDGLMEQIVRHITGPIIRKSIERVERERRRAEFGKFFIAIRVIIASNHNIAKRRSSFLFIKYFSLWRKKAWAKNLRRRGQQFRLSMAESMKALHNSQRNSQTSSMASSPDRNQPEPARMSLASSQRSEMPPPTARPSQHKRSSLPADVQGNSGLRNKLPVGSHVLGSSSSRPTSHRTPHSNHKRSKTSDGFLKSTLSGRLSKTIRTPNSASSMYLVPDDTAYATETLMRRAKHLVRGRTDTTKGDYFRLKAHGLDPDTPVVPLTKKRSRPDEIEATPVKTARRSLSDAAQSSRTPSLTPMGESKSPTSINGSVIKFTEEEEELFAQARELKEALAEGERWFREEREKHERSRSNSLLETDKERKLRELLRDNTPSRTQLRLEATGAHGLWKGRSGGNGGSGKRRESSHMDMDVDEPPKLGLAALTQQANGGSRRAPATNPFGGSSSWGVPAGASADDAIEL